jgi:formate dehydrogenase iron-sulfur subunit
VGFFTDTTVCIGCKACEVACKEWNLVPDDGFNLLGMSFDNTGMLGANSWRHVTFIEQERPLGRQEAGVAEQPTGRSATEDTTDVLADVLRQAERGGELGTTPPHVRTPPQDLGIPSFELPGAEPAQRGAPTSAG